MLLRVAVSRQTLCYVSRSGEGGREWAGEPRESEEMAPGWFDAASLPLDQMWDDEAYRLPRVMAGEALSGVITYDDACELAARAELKAVGPLAGTGKAR